MREHCMCSHYRDWKSYSWTSPQWPPWGQKKVAVVEKWLLWGGRGVIWQINFGGEYNMFVVLSLCLQYPIMVIQSYIMDRDKMKWKKKSLRNVLNQNVNLTKRARFVTFAISNLDNLCILQQYNWNTIKILSPQLIVISSMCHTEQLSWPFLTFSSVSWLKLAVFERLFGSWGHALMSIAVVVIR